MLVGNMKVQEIDDFIESLIEEYSKKYREATFTVNRASLDGSLTSLRRVQDFILQGRGR